MGQPNVTYDTTRPTWYDTEATAAGKLEQLLRGQGKNVDAGLLAKPDNINIGRSDSRLRILQKILIKLQS